MSFTKGVRHRFLLGIVFLWILGCGTATVPAVAPGTPKLVAWGPPSGGTLYVKFYAPTSMGADRKAMQRDPLYDGLKPAGIQATYVAYTYGLTSLSSGDNVVVEYIWRPDSTFTYDRVGEQEFIFSSGTTDYVATP